jgi:N-methylhydantoinase B
MRNWMAVPDTIVDTMWKALTPAMPSRGPAGHHGLLGGGIGIGNRFDANGQIINLRGQNAGSMTGGGWGAVCDADGQPATICINDGDTHAGPTEGGEAKSPDIVLERVLWQDSGGAGKFRGGLGAYQRIETRYAADLFGGGGMSRETCPPFGIFGGKDAPAQKRAYRRKTDAEDHRIVAGGPPVRLSPGDNAVVYQAGGGGFGDPLERDPQAVLADARNEYISLDSARRDYGVVIHRGGPHNRTFTLDESATVALRNQLRGADIR